jgi:aspartate kinase
MQGVVVKFGGSSVATPEKIGRIAEGIIKRKESAGQIVAVVSAMGKTTNGLIELSQGICPDPDKRAMDMLLATGEQVSIALLSMALIARGCPAVALTGWQAGILTEDSHMNSRIRCVDTARLQRELDAGNVVVVAGFQGVTQDDEITTLGRGGSDTTAVALAASLGWPCEIYTDVEGIYNIDPRLHTGAKKLDEISHSETFELSCLGAKVIEPRSVELAAKYGVDLQILLSTMDRPGTRITQKGDIMEQNVVNKISVLDHLLLVNVEVPPENTLGKLFARLADAKVNIDVISRTPSGREVSFTTAMESAPDIARVLDGMQLTHQIKRDNCKVSVVGNAIRTHPGVAARAFNAFYQHKVPFRQVSTSEISISFIVDESSKQQAVQALIEAFGL